MTKAKPCFVLIRGLIREQRHWGDFIPILQRQFPDSEIIALDIPGNGCLHHQTSPNNISAYTDSLRQQLSKKDNINLIALSMGGMVALDWMTRFPTEIKSAVLINTSVRPHSAFFHRLRWQIYPDIFKMLWHTAEQIEQQILDLTSNTYNNNDELLKQWQIWRKQNPVSKTSALNQLIASAKFSAQTKPLHPTLIVASKKDLLVNYCCSQKLQQLWKTDYQEHETAGHDLPLDDPQWLTQVIYRWINTI